MGMIIFLCFLIVAIGVICVNKSEEQREQKIQNLPETERQRYYQDNTIDYTIIVSEDSKKSLGSAITRGAIGAAMLGPVGLVGGAISGKNKAKTTFTIVYKSGRREVVTVDNNSQEFEKYARYIK